MVNTKLFNEIVEQFSSLLSVRGKDVEDFAFENTNNNFINVYIKYKKITSIHLHKFSEKDVFANNSQWKKYKTIILNLIEFVSPDYLNSPNHDISPHLINDAHKENYDVSGLIDSESEDNDNPDNRHISSEILAKVENEYDIFIKNKTK